MNKLAQYQAYSTTMLTFLTHMRDADSPAANAPHLIRQLELYQILLNACQIIFQIAVVLKVLGRKKKRESVRFMTDIFMLIYCIMRLTLSESSWLRNDPLLLLALSSDVFLWAAIIVIIRSCSIFLIFFFLAFLVFILSINLHHPALILLPWILNKSCGKSSAFSSLFCATIKLYKIYFLRELSKSEM